MSRWDDLFEEWATFHEANPAIYRLFHRFTMDRIQLGFTKYSARAIIHRIRWEFDDPINQTDEFRINDHHSPFYARYWMLNNPDHNEFFEIRDQISDGS